ncbi:hypothetical protein GYB22_03385 [bacterium]|nr:hypothetical protein [bacterium]
MESLSKRRPIFHSEADFQFELAWELKSINPELELRMEKPYDINESERWYLDILIMDGQSRIGIELKYKTRVIPQAQLSSLGNLESFRLTNHAATSLGRYDFLKDIERIEYLIENEELDSGFCIFLSNDRSYWTGNPKHSTLGPNFYINPGMTKSGKIDWVKPKESSVGKGRMKPIMLSGHYCMQWFNYEELQPIFSYNLVEITK